MLADCGTWYLLNVLLVDLRNCSEVLFLVLLLWRLEGGEFCDREVGHALGGLEQGQLGQVSVARGGFSIRGGLRWISKLSG